MRLARILAMPIIVTGVFAATSLSGSLETVTVETAPPVYDPAQAIAAEHGCWTGKAPEGVTIPGHVVVTTADGRTVYAGPKVVADALDQVFNHIPHGLTVHAFCL